MVLVGHGGANRAYLGCWSVEPSSQGVGPPVVHPTDTRLQDPLVLDEIELYGELVIAASSSDQRLSTDEIDRVLGVDEPRA
jgi:hypothetical protein